KMRTFIPRQLGQHSTAPFLPPRPSHLSQITFFCRASFLVAPLYKSSNVTESWCTTPWQLLIRSVCTSRFLNNFKKHTLTQNY
uniref:Uncharacterized protein n=1 Tax=Spermophilus dauricus TaxID=99837 RepID=A0A8C9PJH3_SPEDA